MAGREHTNTVLAARTPARRRSLILCLFVILLATAVGLSVLLAAPARSQAAQEYTFTRVADSAEDNFDPFNFGCSTINNRGDVAFRAGRVAPDGFNTVDGIYRSNASNGRLVTIAEDEERFLFIGSNPSMNRGGEVSFAASLEREDPQTGNEIEKILRGNGRSLTTIASTAGKFNFFGFDTSVNNAGRVAFKAELDERFDFDEGLFSGRGGRVTTHYLTSTSRFDGSDSRPSINNFADIAFQESVNFNTGIFVRDGNRFRRISAPDPDRSVGVPVLNDAGTAAFERSFFDEANDEFVTEIVTGRGGPLTTVADTRGPFDSFGFRPPSLDNDGEVAFLANLGGSTTTGIFTGPDAVEDRVITTGDPLDGSTVQNLVFCEEGLNNSGQLAFIADLEDPDSPNGFRTAVFRATPVP